MPNNGITSVHRDDSVSIGETPVGKGVFSERSYPATAVIGEITGDVVNHYQGIELGLPKPRLYSLLVVPEHDEQLTKVRRFLNSLSRQPGVELLVPHDRNQIESTGLPAY